MTLTYRVGNGTFSVLVLTVIVTLMDDVFCGGNVVFLYLHSTALVDSIQYSLNESTHEK